MSGQPDITGWWSYLRAVLLSPIWEFLTVGALFSFLFVATWWRDNFATQDWKNRLELSVLLPHWHPAIWLCVCLLVISFIALWHAFRLWQGQQDALDVYCAKPIIEFVIEIAKDGEEVIGFKIRNTSSENLYNVGIANMATRIGEVWWSENFFSCLDARTGERVVTPSSAPGQLIRFYDMPTLLKAFQTQPGADTYPEDVGNIVVWADGADGARYRFSTAVQLWNLYTWKTWKTERVLVRNK